MLTDVTQIFSSALFYLIYLSSGDNAHYFSLHINANALQLANELIFICSPGEGYNKLVPNYRLDFFIKLVFDLTIINHIMMNHQTEK